MQRLLGSAPTRHSRCGRRQGRSSAGTWWGARGAPCVAVIVVVSTTLLLHGVLHAPSSGHAAPPGTRASSRRRAAAAGTSHARRAATHGTRHYPGHRAQGTGHRRAHGTQVCAGGRHQKKIRPRYLLHHRHGRRPGEKEKNTLTQCFPPTHNTHTPDTRVSMLGRGIAASARAARAAAASASASASATSTARKLRGAGPAAVAAVVPGAAAHHRHESVGRSRAGPSQIHARQGTTRCRG